MMHVSTIITMKGEYVAVPKLSNGAISNDLERPLPPVSRSRHYLSLNILETAELYRHTSIEDE